MFQSIIGSFSLALDLENAGRHICCCFTLCIPAFGHYVLSMHFIASDDKRATIKKNKEVIPSDIGFIRYTLCFMLYGSISSPA